jgi:hypothetical protein
MPPTVEMPTFRSVGKEDNHEQNGADFLLTDPPVRFRTADAMSA